MMHLSFSLLLLSLLVLKVHVNSLLTPKSSATASRLEANYGSVGEASSSVGEILVIGATGRVGRAVVSKLKSSGKSVKCLVRDTRRAETFTELRDTSFIHGSVEDMDALIKATSGCDVVVDVHGMRPPRFTKLFDLIQHPKHDPTHPYNVNYIGTKHVLAAMKINNVKKLVRITGSMTAKSPFIFPVWIFNILLSMSPKWHERSEIAIREAQIDYTVIRPTGIVDEPEARLTQRSLVMLPGDSGEVAPVPGKIAIADLSDIIVRSAIVDGFFSRTSVIVSSVNGTAGPQTWEPLVTKVMKDYKPIIRQPHELAVLFYVGVVFPAIAFTISLLSRLVFKLLQVIVRKSADIVLCKRFF